ncbi:hypothetical protein [Myroides sp.]|uniref:hypothetical protein n=1 Tax=Myroides sp. TaxID=1874736 RepID=UPI0028A89FC8|nr:hypothetical protein [Myroides sp.]
MNLHVFTGNRTHLVPTLIEDFIKIGGNQYFIVFCSNEKYSLYIELFDKFNYTHYVLVSSFSDFSKISKDLKNVEHVILHGTPYGLMWRFIYKYPRVSWVCWGAGAKINYNNWKSIIFTPFKYWLYKSFCKIGVLMPQDGQSLKKDYKVVNPTLVRYLGSASKFPFSIDKVKELFDANVDKKHYKVYLGNNSSCINSYLGLIEALPKFELSVKVNCMLNYSFKESRVSENLAKRGQTIFGDNFIMDTNLYSLEEYYDYMSNCDVYVCGLKQQTGLGAIYTCLRLGKKLYLDGINYEWMISLGCKVFHVSELKGINEDVFLQSLTYNEKLENYHIINNHLDEDLIIENWKTFMNFNKLV